ncbi:MAG: hypothetical protein ACD_78C00359G0001 [uncultured bacterium (gcode 4)]|uniref:Uncharacterized protein n=1 Tax=uncultured bacterium (gcode 4) TaxID=1234023 RepID=K1XGY7_9BACT|nr:MAG: hypothetical protein ACD_78C00359G0001 [uncultured bacterium (gcode 4)]
MIHRQIWECVFPEEGFDGFKEFCFFHNKYIGN